jgi:GT2 family glycosyltransferase
MKLAVVIVNYNTAEELAACLGSLLPDGLGGLDAEVFVVDNASTDGSAARVRSGWPQVHLIRSRANVGFAAANNLALRALRPAAPDGCWPHVLLLNPDTLVPPAAVATMVSLLEREPDVGLLGPKLVHPDGSLDPACRRSFPTPEVSFYRFSGLARLFPCNRRFGRYNLTYLDPDRPIDVDAVVGACMLMRGAAIAQVGLLDERFWMYGEDLDWAFRLRQAGWRVAYRPQVVVVHLKRTASRSSGRARFEFQRAMWLFYAKHYARLTARPIHWLVLAALSLRGGPRLAREIWATRRSAP